MNAPADVRAKTGQLETQAQRFAQSLSRIEALRPEVARVAPRKLAELDRLIHRGTMQAQAVRRLLDKINGAHRWIESTFGEGVVGPLFWTGVSATLKGASATLGNLIYEMERFGKTWRTAKPQYLGAADTSRFAFVLPVVLMAGLYLLMANARN